MEYTVNDKRNEYILEKLQKLNFISQAEGLLFLTYIKQNIVAKLKSKKRCFLMQFYKPLLENMVLLKENLEAPVASKKKIVLDKNETKLSSSENLYSKDSDIDKMKFSITERAVEFCSEHQFDVSSCKLDVSNIPYETKQRELWDFFEYFGKVLRVSIIKDRKTKRSRGFGFIVFSNPYEANAAINAKPYELKINGRLLNVKPACKQKRGRKKMSSTYSSSNATQKLQDVVDYYLHEAGKNEKETLVKNEEETIRNEEEENNCLACGINQLPDDLLVYIFSYHTDLPTRIKCEAVCKRWQQLSISSWLNVRRIYFQKEFQRKSILTGINDRILISILKRGCYNLAVLDLTACYLLTDTSLSLIGKYCKHLEEINLSHVPVKSNTLKVFGKNLVKLKRIYLNTCISVGEKGLWWLFKDLTALEVLHITDNNRLGGKCLYMLPSTLKEVDFTNCAGLSDLGLCNLALHSTHLERLSLNRCTNFTDKGMQDICEASSKLVELNLRELGRHVTESGLSHISNLKFLKKVDISRNSFVDDTLIQRLVEGCPLLASLNMEACHGNVTCVGIRNLAQLKHLRDLNISYIMQVCVNCVSRIAGEGRLERLLVKSCNGFDNDCLIACVNFLEKLSYLDISDCFLVTNDAINGGQIIERSDNPNILELIIGGTGICEENVEDLQAILSPCTISTDRTSQVMLKSNRDITLIPDDEFLDEEEEEVEEEVIARPLHVFKDESAFDVNAEYPAVDEYGDPLWEVVTVQSETSNQNNLVFNQEETSSENTESVQSQLVYVSETEEENWDDECFEGGHSWLTQPEFLIDDIPCENDYDEFLEYDDPTRFELHG